MKNILVLCTGNSCRSQIADGYLKHFAQGKANVYSAGVETHGVNPKAIATMKADGIDIANNTSNNVLEYKDIPFDFIITVCDNAKERCPYFHVMQSSFIIIFQILLKQQVQKKKSIIILLQPEI